MTFLASGFLWVGAAAIVGLIVAHLFSRSRPREAILPTARFVPEGAARAPSRARRPTDLLFLILRIAMVALVALAFAQPVFDGSRRSVARVFLVDVSRAVPASPMATGTAGTVQRAARSPGLQSITDSSTVAEGDVVLAFDTTVQRVAAVTDLVDRSPRGAPASLSAGLVMAIREGATLARRADSVEIVLLSPIATEAIDSATLAIRATWPGRIRVVRSALPGRTASALPIELRASAGDPLRATLDLLDATSDAEVRIVRGLVSKDDSAWAESGARALVTWPAVGEGSVASIDSVGAVIAGGQVVVAPFERRGAPPGGRVVARWVDGVPAATESVHGLGCIRTVAIQIATASDLALRPEFGALVRELTSPCGGQRSPVPASDAVVASIAGSGALADGRALRSADESPPRYAVWLLGTALLLGLVEQLLRRLGGGGAREPVTRPHGVEVTA